MKSRKFVIPTKKRLLAALLTMAMLAGTSIVAAASSPIKSQGNINFNNGTKEDPADDVLFFAEDLYYLNNKVEEQIAIGKEGKENIADSIKNKDPQAPVNEDSSFKDLSDAINNIAAAGSATAADVLSGKTIYNGSGYTAGTLALSGNAQTANVLAGSTFYNNTFNKETGAMKNFAGKERNGGEVTISNTVGTVKITDSGYYDTSSSLTFALPPTDLFKPVGNATPQQVLSGAAFYSDSKTMQTGAMRNKSGINQNTSVSINGNSGVVSIPESGYYDTNSKLTIDLTNNNNKYYESGKQAAAYKVKKLILTDNASEWWSPTGEGYEVQNGNAISYKLGVYSEVYVCVETLTSNRYGGPENSTEVWRESTGAGYNPSTGVISVSYGTYTYAGGDNACKMTVLYR